MSQFKHIGIIGRYRSQHIIDTVQALVDFLKQKNCHVMLEQETAEQLNTSSLTVYDKATLANKADLLIVVGGDGSLLGAARTASRHNTPVLGINRGTLGFLTDVSPHNFEEDISQVLAGNYYEEPRFLLTAELMENNKVIHAATALNEVVLMPGAIPHMIEFETHIDGKFVYKQRADGLIIATPTGSTAYALSGGGPILHPSLDALVMVPMFPHKLSSRPIVVTGDSEISLIISPKTESPPKERLTLPQNGSLRISKQKQKLRLLHPANYDYFETLRNKLGWEETKIGLT